MIRPYSSYLVASIVTDNKRLCDFTKIALEPGETKTVTFLLPAKACLKNYVIIALFLLF